ncbi:MAG: bifunctional (p)ppGpp synthetase/guanosine-3',5'-bis(diphosphate) 3'-pyrophosphohydrolase [Candidatus Sungbacteria bacterium]|nr:bifunctional (p)ppGpp synthetase/guanosine-3',5'-bis(diphosphate) 3'-pyrophosphohydrolase [Candidatus Sungbacteria bacterium]
MDNTNIVEKALTKAIELHKGQVRKGDAKIPYVVHPLEVGIIVARFTNSPELVSAAILHDTVEDCKYPIEDIEEEFGSEVKNLVSSLTEDKAITDWTERKAENLKRLRLNQDAYFIKSADALANMRSLLVAIKEDGSIVWSRFNAPKEKKMEYFKVILQDTEEFLPKKFLEEYVSALKDLEYSEFLEKKTAIGFVAKKLCFGKK